MKVILLDSVARLGSVGSEVEVKNGYARNYLIPQKLAVRATPESRAQFETMRAELEAKAKAKLEEAKALAAKVTELTDNKVVIVTKAGPEGRIFGNVTNRTIAETLTFLGANVDKSQIQVVGNAIRELGEHPVLLKLHSDVKLEIIVDVQAD